LPTLYSKSIIVILDHVSMIIVRALLQRYHIFVAASLDKTHILILPLIITKVLLLDRWIVEIPFRTYFLINV